MVFASQLGIRHQHVADSIVLGRCLVLGGSIRFAIEFIRVNVVSWDRSGSHISCRSHW
jgi:hypothetical protein